MPWPNQHKHLTPIAGTLSDPCLFFSDLLVTSGPATRGSQNGLPPCNPINFITPPPYRCVYGFRSGSGFGWYYDDSPGRRIYIFNDCTKPITARPTRILFTDISVIFGNGAGYGGLVDYLTGGTVYLPVGDLCSIPASIDIELA